MGVLFVNSSNVATEVYGDDISKFDANPNWTRVRSIRLEDQDALIEAERVIAIAKIDGVGTKTAVKLVNADYDCIESISDSSPEEIAEKTGLSTKVSETVYLGAVEYVG
jgi:Holliday junction resolvasome RuvABC DNA-binding subunit